MADVCSTDYNGNELVAGDVVQIRAKVIGSAGGVGQVYLQILEPSGSPATWTRPRTGGAQTDVLPCFDANLVAKV